MYKEVIHHDLLEYPAHFIVHQANCFHMMGAGIAKQIKDKYPEAYLADIKTRKGDSSKLGTYSWAETTDRKWIFNIYSQYAFGNDKRQTSYDALVEGLDRVRQTAESAGSNVFKTSCIVAVPYKMGCNLGGGSWPIVKAILQDIFLDSTATLVVVCREQDLTQK